MPVYLSCNAVHRPLQHEFASTAGRMVLDDDGIQFLPDFMSNTRALRFGYEEIVHAIVQRDARDTVMVTDCDQHRHLFCVFSADMAEGVAAIVRILVQRWQRSRRRGRRSGPKPASGEAGGSAGTVAARPKRDRGQQGPSAKLPSR